MKNITLSLKRIVHFFTHDKSFTKNFFILVSSSIFLIIVITTILFLNFQRITEEIVFTDTTVLLEHSSKNVANNFDMGKMLILQIGKDLSMRNLMYHKPPTEQEKSIGLEQLGNYQVIMQFIDSIYLYNASQEKFYSSIYDTNYSNRIISQDEFYDKEMVGIIEKYSEYQAYSVIPRISFTNNEIKPFYTFFGYDFSLKNSDGKLLGAIILNISTENLQHFATEYNDVPEAIIPEGETIIVDRTGKIVTNSVNYPMLSSININEYSTVIKNTPDNNYLITDINGVKTFVAYTTPDELGWQYLRLIPYTYITREITYMRNLTAIILFGIIILSSVSLVIINKILYKPVEILKSTLEDINSRTRKSYFNLKQDLLRKIILDYSLSDWEENQDKFKQFCISFPKNGYYIGLLISIDYHKEFVDAFSANDRDLYKFAIINIAEELCNQIFTKTEIVDLHENQLFAIIYSSGSEIDTKTKKELLHNISLAVESNLPITISCALSETSYTFDDIQFLYAVSKETMSKKFFSGPKSILLSEDFSLANTNYIYPEQKEKQLQDAIIKGKSQLAKEIYNEIINQTQIISYAALNIASSKLLIMFHSIALNYFPDKISKSQFYFKLSNLEFKIFMDKEIYSIIDYLVNLFQDKKENKTSEIIDKINTIINEEYYDPSLSVDSIATRLNISTSYLGKIYKQNCLIPILSYLQNVRLEKSKYLLECTNDPISTIAKKCGYSSDSYYYKVFRNENGLTPSDYRRNYLNNINTEIKTI